jgi:kynurenine formamidase
VAGLTAGLVACQGDAGSAGEAAWPPLPGSLVDLSYAFGPDTLYWPTETRGFEHETLAEGDTERGYYYSSYRFAAPEHGGTHLDAPIHFRRGGATADAIPLERLVGRGLVVDVSARVEADPDYEIQVGDIQAWEAVNGPIPAGAIVLLRTGYGARWPDRERYLGTDRRGPEAIAELHFPGLHPRAAAWLRDQRRVGAVGIDTASIDRGQSTLFGSHVALFEGNIPVFENVANLAQLPASGFLVMALPMKIAGGSGGPLRIIAAW